jgi:phosphoribosylglycinamide formyltransferase-1
MVIIAVFCSGSGSNFQAIAEAIQSGAINNARIALMVTDNPQCFARERAKKLGIEEFLVERKNFKTKDDFERCIIEELRKKKVDLIVLAGYMKMVGASLLKQYEHKILNIHPALLPSFKGTHGIRDALAYGVKITGPTVHFVDADMDHGPIVLQGAVLVRDDDTEETLAPRIHEAEHELYPRAIKLFVEGKLHITGRKVVITHET